MKTKDRKTAKIDAIERRILEIAPNAKMLLGILDETKLDMLILGLGLGSVDLSNGGE